MCIYICIFFFFLHGYFKYFSQACSTSWKIHYIHFMLKRPTWFDLFPVDLPSVLGTFMVKELEAAELSWVLMPHFKFVVLSPALWPRLWTGYAPAPLLVCSLVLLLSGGFWIWVIAFDRTVFEGKLNEKHVAFYFDSLVFHFTKCPFDDIAKQKKEDLNHLESSHWKIINCQCFRIESSFFNA